MLLARLERGRKEREATGDEREFTLLILIYIIYLEEFIVNLMRFEALMPFLWMLRMSILNFPSSPLYFYLIHTLRFRGIQWLAIRSTQFDYFVRNL